MKKLLAMMAALCLLSACVPASAGDGDSLSSDQTVNTVSYYGNYFIDLNGHTLTVNSGIEIGHDLDVNNGTLIVKDGGMEIGGALRLNNVKLTVNNSNGLAIYGIGGDTVIKSSTVAATGRSKTAASPAKAPTAARPSR